MGEAKRRKKALGNRYGQTRSVLIHGDYQLDSHSDKFSNAYFEKLRELGKGLFTTHWVDNTKSVESQSSLSQDTESPAMQTWLKHYLDPYRPQDAEKLVNALLEPLFTSLSADEEEDPEQESEPYVSQIILDLTICIISFNSLKAFLSQQAQAKYREILHTIYIEMINEIEEDGEIEDKEKVVEIERLNRLFRGSIIKESSPA